MVEVTHLKIPSNECLCDMKAAFMSDCREVVQVLGLPKVQVFCSVCLLELSIDVVTHNFMWRVILQDDDDLKLRRFEIFSSQLHYPISWNGISGRL